MSRVSPAKFPVARIRIHERAFISPAEICRKVNIPNVSFISVTLAF